MLQSVYSPMPIFSSNPDASTMSQPQLKHVLLENTRNVAYHTPYAGSWSFAQCVRCAGGVGGYRVGRYRRENFHLARMASSVRFPTSGTPPLLGINWRVLYWRPSVARQPLSYQPATLKTWSSMGRASHWHRVVEHNPTAVIVEGDIASR
jgi:hypothetical protein